MARKRKDSVDEGSDLTGTAKKQTMKRRLDKTKIMTKSKQERTKKEKHRSLTTDKRSSGIAEALSKRCDDMLASSNIDSDEISMSDDDEDFSDIPDDSEFCDPDKDRGQRHNQPSNRQLEKFKGALAISDSDLKRQREANLRQKEQKEQKETFCQVKTVALQKKKAPVQFTVFEEPGRKKKPKVATTQPQASSPDDPSVDGNTEDVLEFDMSKARSEIRRFGVNRLQGKEKEQGMVDLLVQLGAKRPKQACLNYRELTEQRKADKVKAAEKMAMDRQFGFKVVNPNKHKRRKREMGGVDGQLGSYKDGVQVVRRREINSVLGKQRGRR